MMSVKKEMCPVISLYSIELYFIYFGTNHNSHLCDTGTFVINAEIIKIMNTNLTVCHCLSLLHNTRVVLFSLHDKTC